MKKKSNNKIENYILDECKSKLDIRDTIAETLKEIKIQKIEKTKDYRSLLPPVKDQKKQGSCSAQTGACIKEYQEFSGKPIVMSAQFLHNHRPFPKLKKGSTPRSTMRNLLYYGICKEKQYPYGKIERQIKISKKLRKNALQYKIKAYAKVTTVNGLKRALCCNGVCYLSVPVYNNSAKMWIKHKKQKKRGYHAMAVVGYNKKGFILRNSWGKKWNYYAHTVFPFSHWDLHSECWTAFDIKNNNEIPKNRFKSFMWTLARFPKRITKRFIWRLRNK